MKNVTFNSSSSIEHGLRILSWERDPLPEVRDHYEYLPGRHGIVHFPQPLGSRNNSVEFRLFSRNDEERIQKITEIMSWLHTDEFMPLEFDDEPGIHYLAKINDKPDVTNITPFQTDFVVEWICQPFKMSNEEHLRHFDVDGINPIEVEVGGNVDTPPIIEITASSSVSSLILEINGEVIKYDGDIMANNRIIIDSLEYAFMVNDELKVEKVTGLFPVLQPGRNEILANLQGEIMVMWRDYYK